MRNEKSNFGYNVANFDTFHWIISSSINLLFLKSAPAAASCHKHERKPTMTRLKVTGINSNCVCV